MTSADSSHDGRQPAGSDGAGGPGDPVATRRSAPSARRILTVFGIVAAVALALDIVSKVLVVANIAQDSGSVRILGGFIYLIQTRNSGAAFSTATGMTAVLTVISVVVAVVLIRAARRITSSWWAFALGLVFGGAVGNLVDRLFRAPGVLRGRVVDWIAVLPHASYVWPTFNLADSAICVGAVTAVILTLCGVSFSDPALRSARKHSQEQPDHAESRDAR